MVVHGPQPCPFKSVNVTGLWWLPHLHNIQSATSRSNNLRPSNNHDTATTSLQTFSMFEWMRPIRETMLSYVEVYKTWQVWLCSTSRLILFQWTMSAAQRYLSSPVKICHIVHLISSKKPSALNLTTWYKYLVIYEPCDGLVCRQIMNYIDSILSKYAWLP